MWEDKETTAPIPSVAPDGEQPSALARTVSITEIEETHKQFGKIQIMTMPELMETRFRVRPAVIDGLLTAGTYLLAGAPKIGKSFLVLQMAYQVSMGAPFLGFSSRQGTVLYLALEDTCERLQKRLAQMTEQDSEHLILSVFSETLDEGLTERLSDFWSEHTDTVLIIIDTLQRVRGRTPDNGSYAADYDTLARLKEFSDTYGVTVLVVHHTRKEGAEDVFNMISGTNGLMGAADGALLLHKDKRTASDAERAAGYAAAEIRHSLCCPAHKRGQEPFAAVGRCTVMYGMYGKNGSGGIPSKYRTLSDIPYIIGHTVHRQGHFPPPAGAGNDHLRESRGNGWHTDFGTKSSVLYPSRRGTGKLRGDAAPRATLTGPKKKDDR